MNKKLNIWLAYVSYPVTTAVYFERALRQKHNVITIGPKIRPELIELWDLKSLKLPIVDHNISTTYTPDVAEILSRVPKNLYPDLFLWIESVPGYHPVNISKLNCPTACLLIDSHLNLETHVNWAKEFEHVFIVHKQYIQNFKEAGIKQINWLPVGCDKEIHSVKKNNKLFNVGFVGTLQGSTAIRRVNLLNKINAEIPVSFKRCFWDEMSEFLGASKIVFNNAIINDLNMRLFETMSIGSFLLTDMAKDSGQKEMFVDGEDYVIYDDENILDKVKYYLSHEGERERIAKNGQKKIHAAHTYSHRCEELLKVISGERTNTPSPEEWKEKSQSVLRINVPFNAEMLNDAAQKPSNRSFVIPVLDMSPASPFNILTLLKDLENIPGEVNVIFNSVEMAEKLKSHPRINNYAIMKKNVGVSRAWNIGLNMSSTPVTLILNSDLHIEADVVDQLEKALYELPAAAIVGPQGSLFNYETASDFQYFDKGGVVKPIEVDAVSGFLFAVKTELFNSGILKFDNQYTPCYFEEWDTGLQCKMANLKSYVVPVTGYEHEWSGSIRALRTIKYLDKEETAGEIHSRNRILFLKKWNDFKNNVKDGEKILHSLWIKYMFEMAEDYFKKKMFDKADEVYLSIVDNYKDNVQILAEIGSKYLKIGNLQKAVEYFEKIEKLDPEYKVSDLEVES